MRQITVLNWITLCILLVSPTAAQINYTANDQVPEYDGYFGYGTNVGYFPQWPAMAMGDIAMGNDWLNIPGVGVTTMRPALTEEFQEVWGYEYRIRAFDRYQQLGAVDNVVFVGYPSPEHTDPIEYCKGQKSRLFSNLYAPIWDGGANGTPYNDDNFYAAYLYKTVSIYKDYIKFWEVWNEPDFSFTASSIHPEGVPGNWWENNPNPCEYALHAPIFHYIRMLRISYEVIKTVDPDAYIALGGIGFPSFLDALLRNTDNPIDGSTNDRYPLKGGAYFDVVSYHVYPHLNNSIREWDNERGGFVFKRHTDAAARGVIDLKQKMEKVLFQYQYDGFKYPQKKWIITESNVPRKPLNQNFGSDEIQRNFIIKALVECQKNDILQFHVYTLGDRSKYREATAIYQEFNLMGLYNNLFDFPTYQQEENDIGIAYKTTSDLLYTKRFDPTIFNALKLPDGVKGGVFTGKDGSVVYVLWAETFIDQSERALKVVNLQELTGAATFERRKWDFSRTGIVEEVNANAILVTGAPQFFTPKGQRVGQREHSFQINNLKASLLPNAPAHNHSITLELEEAQQISFLLIDQLGRKQQIGVPAQVLNAGNHIIDLNTSMLKAGVYYLSILATGDQRITTLKMIKVD